MLDPRWSFTCCQGYWARTSLNITVLLYHGNLCPGSENELALQVGSDFLWLNSAIFGPVSSTFPSYKSTAGPFSSIAHVGGKKWGSWNAQSNICSQDPFLLWLVFEHFCGQWLGFEDDWGGVCGGCGAKFCRRRYGCRPESLDQRFITHNFFVDGFSSMNLPSLGVNTGKALVHAEDSARSNAFPSQHEIQQSACSDCFHWWSSLFPSPFSQDVALDPWIACTKYGYARCLWDSPCSLEDGAPSNRMSVQFNSQPRARMCEIYSIMVFSSAFGMAWLLSLPSSNRLFPPLNRSRKVLLGIPKWAAACRWDICFLITAMMASWIFSTGCLTRLFFGAASAFSSVYSGGSILTSTFPWHSWRQVTCITISI